TKGVVLDKFTGMEARVMGEAARCAAGQRVSDMNETIQNLLNIYEPMYTNPDLGKTFQECYDVTTVKPTKEYLEVYDKALQTIRDAGLDIKH
ncbi:MAG: monomethylamine:corrinoid methyltransferase, partial [archaeon]|nr:monomethylamine:corrinoid methyltransferase [archaeon]